MPQSLRIVRTPAVIGVAVLVLTALACGSDTDESSAPAPSPQPAAAARASEPKRWSAAPAMTIDQNKQYTATLKTSKGTIVVELFAKEAPVTVNNFVFLSRQGFYNGVKFHRIIKDFMVQTGDPLGTGSGGPGYSFRDEPVTKPYVRGTLAMANAGPNTNGSQFFIVHQDYALQPNYTIFGLVRQGLDVLDAIANTPVQRNAFGEPSQPTETVLIQSVEIAEK